MRFAYEFIDGHIENLELIPDRYMVKDESNHIGFIQAYIVPAKDSSNVALEGAFYLKNTEAFEMARLLEMVFKSLNGVTYEEFKKSGERMLFEVQIDVIRKRRG